MWVEEKGVVAPGERLASPVQEVVGGGLREFAAVLVFDVFNVSGVGSLSVVDPCNTNSNLKLISDLGWRRRWDTLTSWDANIVASRVLRTVVQKAKQKKKLRYST